jgi:hypothetical protein
MAGRSLMPCPGARIAPVQAGRQPDTFFRENTRLLHARSAWLRCFTARSSRGLSEL